MTRSIRPSVPDDAPAIVSLFDELGLHPNARARDLQWKYWAPRADFPGPRSYVLTSDGIVVAHAALVPGVILSEGRRSTSAHVIDWVARRGHGGAGVALMKYIGQQVDCLLAFGGSDDTLRILPHIGFRGVGSVTGFARPLFPLRALNPDVRISWRLMSRLARNLVWKYTLPQAPYGERTVRPVTDHDEIARLASCMPRAIKDVAVFERRAEQLRYVLECTIVKMSLYSVDRAGCAPGYFMLAYAAGQVRIVDIWTNSLEPLDWQAMVNSAVAQANQHPEASEIVMWASHLRQANAAISCGFRARFELPIQIRIAAGASLNASGLNVQLLDNDAAYLHEGVASHWI